jgi:HAD superfamily hydrolase (TIGR01509 family)
VRAVLFDHDGTLVDSEQVHADLWRTVLARFGKSFSIAEYKKYYAGIPTRANAIDMVRRFGIPEQPELLIELKEAALQAYLTEQPFPLMPGAFEVVHCLNAAGLTLGVVTGAGAGGVRSTVNSHFPHAPFATLVSGDDVARSKPAPDCYLAALSRLSLASKDCVALEDTETGVRAASAAEIRCIAVPGPLSDHQDFSLATYVATDLKDAVAWMVHTGLISLRA